MQQRASFSCVDCGNPLSRTARECGNPQCKSTDPFGKERALKRRQFIGGTILVLAALAFTAALHFQIVTPQDIHDFLVGLFNMTKPQR